MVIKKFWCQFWVSQTIYFRVLTLFFFPEMVIILDSAQHYKDIGTLYLCQSVLVFFKVKGSQLGVFCPWAIVYCYIEFKLRYLKNLKLFSIRVKRIIWACSVMNKSRWVFALFKSIFLRNRSFSNGSWFYGKKRKIGKGNLHLTENQLSRNEVWCAADYHSYTCHIIICKRIFRFELKLRSYWQNIIFLTKLPPRESP